MGIRISNLKGTLLPINSSILQIDKITTKVKIFNYKNIYTNAQKKKTTLLPINLNYFQGIFWGGMALILNHHFGGIPGFLG